MAELFANSKMAELFANSGDPDQTPHSAASDQGLHCLAVTRLGVSSLQWVKEVNIVLHHIAGPLPPTYHYFSYM